MPGVLIVEAMAQTGAVAVLSEEENRGKLALFAGIDDVRFKRIVEPGDELDLECASRPCAGPIGEGKATAHVGGELAARGTLTFAVERRDRHRQRRRDLDHRARLATCPSGWSRTTTSRRWSTRPTSGSASAPGSASAASPRRSEALSDLALPGRARGARPAPALEALGDRPDHRRDGHAGHDVPLDRRDPRRRARRARRRCVRPLGRLHRLHVRASRRATGWSPAASSQQGARRRRRRALEDPGLDRPLDRACSSATVRARSCSSGSRSGGFLGFELGADGAGGPHLYLPAGGSRTPASAESVEERQHFVQMNGREVFKFATRVLVCSARGRARRVRAHASTTSTSTFRTRRTCGSSTMRGRSSAFRRRRWW